MAGMLAALASAWVAAQKTGPPQPQTPVFRKSVSYHNVDVQVRNAKGVFVPNLTKNDFEVFEDGVRQTIEVFYPTIGGRTMPSPVAPTSGTTRAVNGMILPKPSTVADSSGRIFVILIDDASILTKDSLLARKLLRDIRNHLINDNDQVGIVSSGPSAIEMDIAYDYGHVRLDEAIDKVIGNGMDSDQIITANQGSEGPVGLRYNAHLAMKTANGILQRAAQVTDKKKAFLYISSGYDFNPFQDSRLEYQQNLYNSARPNRNANANDVTQQTGDPNQNLANQNPFWVDPFMKEGNRFAEADLAADMAELIRNAIRANMTIYTLDPRGLQSAQQDIGNTYTLSTREYAAYTRNTVDSIRAIAEGTGGFCACDVNDYRPALDRINNETSDFYTIGYNSTNVDPFKIHRRVEIRVRKPNLELFYNRDYTLPRPTAGK